MYQIVNKFLLHLHHFNLFLFQFIASLGFHLFPPLPLCLLLNLRLPLLISQSSQILFEDVAIFGFEGFETGVSRLDINVVDEIEDNVLDFF